jgi:hypothetical protein
VAAATTGHLAGDLDLNLDHHHIHNIRLKYAKMGQGQSQPSQQVINAAPDTTFASQLLTLN